MRMGTSIFKKKLLHVSFAKTPNQKEREFRTLKNIQPSNATPQNVCRAPSKRPNERERVSNSKADSVLQFILNKTENVDLKKRLHVPFAKRPIKKREFRTLKNIQPSDAKPQMDSLRLKEF